MKKVIIIMRRGMARTTRASIEICYGPRFLPSTFKCIGSEFGLDFWELWCNRAILIDWMVLCKGQ